MPGTQETLYAEIDLELSWSESELPQSERTKHVHGLHPYLGKFPPQLLAAFREEWGPRYAGLGVWNAALPGRA